jgi:hypothetical protein
MFGEDSFDHPLASPWETLLSGASLPNLKSKLQFARPHFAQNFQAVLTDLETLDKKTATESECTTCGILATSKKSLLGAAGVFL